MSEKREEREKKVSKRKKWNDDNGRGQRGRGR